MRHHEVDTSLAPIRLLFAAVCPICLPAHSGLNPDGVSGLECAGYPTAADLLYFVSSRLHYTRFSVSCQ